MRFTGDLEQLKSKLIDLDGEWTTLNPNQVQFRDPSGGVMNWYPSTGKINFQGSKDAATALEAEVARYLNVEHSQSNSSPNDQRTEEEPQNEKVNCQTKRQSVDLAYEGSELVIGLVSAIGTDLEQVTRLIDQRLRLFGYDSNVIKISHDIIAELQPSSTNDSYFTTVNQLMDGGNLLRRSSGDASVLALAAAARINQQRIQESEGEGEGPLPRRAFIISSLKHPDEVHRLRSIYSLGFFLVGVNADEKRRYDFLTRNKGVTGDEAQSLMDRDAEESETFGQHTRDTFHLADFFLSLDNNNDKLQGDLWRVLDLMFGKPYVTPTFDEYAMFMAFSAALRSADLSRQVGAVVTQRQNIVSSGANDVPQATGGLYWPGYDEGGAEIVDRVDGRDYMRGYDSNAREKRAILDDVIKAVPDDQKESLRLKLRQTKLSDITEYGRMVHAEMEAILACSRMGISTQGGVLYCTTFPCHNCAKHIVAAGIMRVVYVEPYPKSKALEFHSDSVTIGDSEGNNVVFAPFVGVGPRSFFNLFSTRLGAGYPLTRKTQDGEAVTWTSADARLRLPMLPLSYIDREVLASALLDQLLEQSL